MLYAAQSVLSMDATQSVSNFTYFRKLRSSISWKEQILFLSVLAPTITQVPKYLGKATPYTTNTNFRGGQFEKDLYSALSHSRWEAYWRGPQQISLVDNKGFGPVYYKLWVYGFYGSVWCF